MFVRKNDGMEIMVLIQNKITERKRRMDHGCEKEKNRSNNIIKLQSKIKYLKGILNQTKNLNSIHFMDGTCTYTNQPFKIHWKGNTYCKDAKRIRKLITQKNNQYNNEEKDNRHIKGKDRSFHKLNVGSCLFGIN